MTEQIIEIETESLEEAREQLKSQVPEGLHLLSEQIISDGKPKTVKAVADTTEEAFAKAQAEIPKEAEVLEKKEQAAEWEMITIEAFDEIRAEREAKYQIKRQFGTAAMLKGLELATAGSKGFLGIGKRPNQYEVNGEWVDMQVRTEKITVLGREEPVTVLVRSTRNGLVASDYMVEGAPFTYREGEPDLHALSYAWTALQPVDSLDGVLGVLRAQDWEEFGAAVEKFEAGKQNWLYADVDGNIGYIMPGIVPVRAGGDGTLPVPGWNDDYQWVGSIPYEEAPRVFNPASGYIINANNPQYREGDYPYLIAREQDRGQRAQRVIDLLEADSDSISLEDITAFQTDQKSLSALEIIPYLEGIAFSNEDIAGARDSLLEWDAQMGMESPQAALFNIFWRRLLEAVFHDQLSPEIAPYGGHAASDIVYFLLQEPDNPWWDDVRTPEMVERRDDILEAAFIKAWGEGYEMFGEYPGDWRWGDLHTITFRNSTLGNSGIGVIENIFNRGPYPTGGSESVIQKTCWSATKPYEVICIPALRQVIDLGDLGKSRMIHSLGQSGHPGHRYYDHFVDPWRFFEHHPSNWERADIEAGEHDLLRLEPGG